MVTPLAAASGVENVQQRRMTLLEADTGSSHDSSTLFPLFIPI